jgi:hypothetical protein
VADVDTHRGVLRRREPLVFRLAAPLDTLRVCLRDFGLRDHELRSLAAIRHWARSALHARESRWKCPGDDLVWVCSRLFCPKPQIESHEYQDNANVRYQPFPESVSEKSDIQTNYDGHHCHHVQRDSDLSARFSLHGLYCK